jgi:hypothetical protein
LSTWTTRGKCPGANEKGNGFKYRDAPYVFKFQDQYWMLINPHDDLGVYRSADAGDVETTRTSSETARQSACRCDAAASSERRGD